MSHAGTLQTETINALYIQAVRRGESHWFRVKSSSMSPLIQVGDAICIEPIRARALKPGEIAAFEGSAGLLIHRILQRQFGPNHCQFLQMGDKDYLTASWIPEQRIVGRVSIVRNGERWINLERPLAQACGTLIAYFRSQVYQKRGTPLALSKSSRAFTRLAGWGIRLFCSSSLLHH